MLEPIHIPRLQRLREQTETLEFNEPLADLETLTPVKGQVRVSHKGNYLDVAGQAETIVTLSCHRCLQQFNHRLQMTATEMIWLTDGEAPPDVNDLPFDEDLDVDAMVESLPKDGNFDAAGWVYEQLCLAMPQRQLCDANCAGIELPQTASQNPDRRWAGLEVLRAQLPDT
ncbi:MAG: YceD family protein [Synechococcales bacterium]|nr:YceD family protein [Synechococcales bacterium]